jgi:hypothetical protein
VSVPTPDNRDKESRPADFENKRKRKFYGSY